jgi:2-oxoisovalerate dehydrogenase E1 component
MPQLDLYRAMVMAREIDKLEAEIVARGEAPFHVSGAGHEGTACIAGLLTRDDWLHCHYRDKALMLARGLPPQEFFETLYCTEACESRGRQMSAHFSAKDLHILTMTIPVGNNALQAVGVAAEIKNQAGSPLVYVGVGDGTTQQGEFLEACAEAVREKLPVLFFIQDNRWAISTNTEGRTFYSLPESVPSQFFGTPIHHVDGRYVAAAERDLERIVAGIRIDRGPAIVVYHVERLANHTNADDQSIYREETDIQQVLASGDPIENFAKHLLANGWTEEQLAQVREDARQAVQEAEAAAAKSPAPKTIHTAKRELPPELTAAASEQRGTEAEPRLTMREAIREVLRHQLQSDERVTLYGEDIEDPKGDVFGVTKGLSTQFGRRVRNSPLSESTIVGTSVGRAMVGGRPVAFLQFADFIPLAFNQICCELGSIHWRSGGKFEAPVIIMAACGGYRPGLGPFHAQTYEALVAHTPGVDVMMPATAEDAAGMLNAAFASKRPTLFLYPKSLLNDPANTTSADVDRQLTPVGRARIVRSGQDVTLVGWGNTVRICRRVAETMANVGIQAEVIDLRSLSPWDKETVLASAEKTARLVVVHEDNHTCGIGAEVVATVSEEAQLPVTVERVTRADTLVPCNFANQMEVLPSFERVLGVVAELLNFELTWQKRGRAEPGVAFVEAVGSGPADETVTIVEIHVAPGAAIKRGDIVATLEATKSVFDLTASVTGTLEQVLVEPGATVPVGTPIFKLLGDASSARRLVEDPGTPILKPKRSERLKIPHRGGERRAAEVGISSVAAISGSRVVANSELLADVEGLSSEDVTSRTGITHRNWVSKGESAVSMAVAASRRILKDHGLGIEDINLLICSTTTPSEMTPSTACQILGGLGEGKPDLLVQAYDINAACSGYLYALQAGYDYLQSRPEARVLVATAESLSQLLNPADKDTVFLFGDASSATILFGEAHLEEAAARLYQPELSAKVDTTTSLSVPFTGDGFIQMDGRKVFSEAVRAMVSSLNRCCLRLGLSVADLEMIVPHQANDRITQAIQRRVGVEVFSNIREHGNTSSTSIPLCLADMLPKQKIGTRLGLCAFGGGFTFGAAVIELLKDGAAIAGSNGARKSA